MIPLGLFFGGPRDGAEQSSIEIRRQRDFQQCQCQQQEIADDKIIGKSSETIEKDVDATRVDPGRYGVEYHLECTLTDYL